MDENKAPEREQVVKMLMEQVEQLLDWNKKNVDSDPEQARRNLETVFPIVLNFQSPSFEA